MYKISKRVTAAITAGILCLQMTGCSLAVTEDTKQEEQKQHASIVAVNAEKKDQLCGVFTVYGDKVPVSKEKIYAKKKGTEYTFQGIDGSMELYYDVTEEGDEYPHSKSVSTGYLGTTSSSSNTNQDTNTEYREIITSVDVVYKKPKQKLHLYPVYMDEKKQMYLVTDTQHVMEVDEMGADASDIIQDSYTYKQNDKTKEIELKINVGLHYVDELEYVVIKEMNQKDQVIKTSTYKGTAFETYKDKDGNTTKKDRHMTLKKGTAYLLVEDHVVTKEKEQKVRRRAIKVDDEDTDNNYVICEFAEENGLVIASEIVFKR